MSVHVSSWAWQQDLPIGTKLVLLKLADCANEDGECHPSKARMAAECGMSRRAIQGHLQKLREQGLLVRHERWTVNGRQTSNMYVLAFGGENVASPEGEGSFSPEGERSFSGGENVASPSIEEPSLEPSDEPSGDLQEQSASPTARENRKQIEARWGEHTPTLIRHRHDYFKSRATQTLIDRAVREHGLEEVLGAITNYATILASDEYVWSHRWPLREFFKRGLDRFVPEAEPLRNYQADPERGMSVQEILHYHERGHDERAGDRNGAGDAEERVPERAHPEGNVAGLLERAWRPELPGDDAGG